jgi:hypothetical protein
MAEEFGVAVKRDVAIRQSGGRYMFLEIYLLRRRWWIEHTSNQGITEEVV